MAGWSGSRKGEYEKLLLPSQVGLRVNMPQNLFAKHRLRTGHQQVYKYSPRFSSVRGLSTAIYHEPKHMISHDPLLANRCYDTLYRSRVGSRTLCNVTLSFVPCACVIVPATLYLLKVVYLLGLLSPESMVHHPVPRTAWSCVEVE